jgi:hypothetical protein
MAFRMAPPPGQGILSKRECGRSRRGIGEVLMRAAEDAARVLGRRRPTPHTMTVDWLCRRLGRIGDTAFFYNRP